MSLRLGHGWDIRPGALLATSIPVAVAEGDPQANDGEPQGLFPETPFSMERGGDREAEGQPGPARKPLVRVSSALQSGEGLDPLHLTETRGLPPLTLCLGWGLTVSLVLKEVRCQDADGPFGAAAGAPDWRLDTELGGFSSRCSHVDGSVQPNGAVSADFNHH